MTPKTQVLPKSKGVTKRRPAPAGYASETDKTKALVQNALAAAYELSSHFKRVQDDSKMYKTNQAWHILWELL